LTLKKKI